MSKFARSKQEMWRLTVSLLFVAGFAGVAGAHTLSTDEGLLPQLHHQVLGLHHLPLTAILIVSGIVIMWRYLHCNARQHGGHTQ